MQPLKLTIIITIAKTENTFFITSSDLKVFIFVCTQIQARKIYSMTKPSMQYPRCLQNIDVFRQVDLYVLSSPLCGAYCLPFSCQVAVPEIFFPYKRCSNSLHFDDKLQQSSSKAAENKKDQLHQ